MKKENIKNKTTTDLSTVHYAVIGYFKVGYSYPFETAQNRDIVYLRKLFHYLSREFTNRNLVTLEKIGSYSNAISKSFTKTAVLKNCQSIEGYLTYDKQVQKDVKEIIKLLN